MTTKSMILLTNSSCTVTTCQVMSAQTVQYSFTSDFRIMQQACARYPLRGAMVSVQQVKTYDSIQVHGVKGMSRQSLELYFESTRMSGGGPIKKINEHQDEDCVTIQFKDSKSKCWLLAKRNSFYSSSE